MSFDTFTVAVLTVSLLAASFASADETLVYIDKTFDLDQIRVVNEADVAQRLTEAQLLTASIYIS